MTSHPDTFWASFLKNYDLGYMHAIFNAANFDPESPSWFLGKTTAKDARYLTPEFKTTKTAADDNLPVDIDAMRAFIEAGQHITPADLEANPDLKSGFMFSTVSNYEMASALTEWTHMNGYNHADLLEMPEHARAMLVHSLWFKGRDAATVSKDPLVVLIRKRLGEPTATPDEEWYCGVFQDIYADTMSEDPDVVKARSGLCYDLAAFKLFIRVYELL